MDNVVFLKARTDVIDNGGTLGPNGGSITIGGNLSVPSGSIVAGVNLAIGGNALVSQHLTVGGSGFFSAGPVTAPTGFFSGLQTQDLTVPAPGFMHGRFQYSTGSDTDQTFGRNRLIVGHEVFHTSSVFWAIDSSGESFGDWVEVSIGDITTGNVTVTTSSGTLVTLSNPGTVWVRGVLTQGFGWRVLAKTTL